MTDWKKVIVAIAPHARADISSAVAIHADECFERYRIKTALRQSHFLAHMSHESTGLTKLDENLSYSAERLTQVWKKRFPTIASAQPYAFNPKKLAEKVYGGRMGNVNPGDGFLFRGHGLLQETGRDNVTELAEHFGITPEEAAEWLVSPAHMLECACARFVLNGCIPFADRDDIAGSTRAINGGTTGLDDRTRLLAIAKRALSAATPNPFGLLDADAASLAVDGGDSAGSDGDAPISDSKRVEAAQRRLRSLGYFPGKIDGEAGQGFLAALAMFQDENGLPTTGRLDQRTFAELSSVMALPRRVSDERAHATVDDLREKGSETISATDDAESALTSKLAVGSIGTYALSGFVEKASTFQDAVERLPSLAKFFFSNIAIIFFVVMILILFIERKKILKSINKIRGARLREHTSGENMGR